MQKRDREAVTYGPMLDRDISRETRLNRLYNGTEAHCISELRMRKNVFHMLCQSLRSRGLLTDTLNVTVEEQVEMFMHVVGHKWSNRAIGFEFIRSGETVSRYFNEVLDACAILARELIYIRTTETHPKITSNLGRFHPYFEECIGALDGTHIPAFVPAHMQDRFRGRKSIPTQNVLAAVDFDLRFIYVLAGWEGSAYDSYVLEDALRRPTGLKIPEGKFFLADAGYAARPGILPPYRGVRYHLKEYKGGREPENYKELYNHRHSSLRTTIERAFGTLKNRFQILKSQPNFPLKIQVKIVLACCGLHNWILEHAADDEYVYDEESWYRALPMSNRTYSDIRAESQAWVLKRDQIARSMWRDKVGESSSELNHPTENMIVVASFLQLGKMVKKKGKLDVDGPIRARTITWEEDQTKFMLNWYIEYRKHQHAGFVWKKPHHAKCADALNKEFGMGVTIEHVNRRYREYKDKWRIVERALSNSGNGFDAIRCKVTIFESEKKKIKDVERRLLSKPIKFYEMEELFKGSHADGSLAMDQETCLDDDKSSDSDDSGGLNDISGYAHRIDLEGDDSDTLPSPEGPKTSPNYEGSGENSSKSPRRSEKKRPRGVKSPSKKPTKSKSRFADATEDISTTMKVIANTLTQPPPPPPVPISVDPHAELWKRLEALSIRADDKITVGVYLA